MPLCPLPVLAVPAAVLLLGPAPSRSWQALTAPAADPTAPLLALVALAATALSVWLLAGALLVALGALPGLAGTTARALAALTLPFAARRALEVALGAGLVLGAGAAPAAATTSVPGAPVTTTSLDWPATTTPAPAPAPLAGTVVVRSGDTLWGLAEQGLRDAGDPAPTAAAVAATWPAWWAANREAVGDDPHLLRPGTPLLPPS